MARKYIKLSPFQQSALIAKLKPIDSETKVYFTFVPNRVYEVDDVGLVDLKRNNRLILYGKGEMIQRALDMKLKYKKTIPCISCAKRKGRDPENYARYEFEMFLEVDIDGNILENEYV